MLEFMIWSVIGCVFIGLGIYIFRSKKEVAFGFWANAEMFPVEDIKAYNCAVGKLWFVFGIVFVFLGIPLLEGQNSSVIIISVLGVMVEVISIVIIYVLIIEKKYRKR